MDSIFKNSIDTLYASLIQYGYHKEAQELQAASPAQVTNQPSTKVPQTSGRFQTERPPQQVNKPQEPIFKGQAGSAAPVIELSRIIDHIEQSSSFQNLPENVIQGILKIKKMTRDAFRYASSEKEAFFGGEKNTVKDLQNFLLKFDKSNPNRKLPEEISRALNQLNFLVTKHIDSMPKDKTLFEKGKDVAKGVFEKGKGIVQDVAEKGKGIVQDVAEKGKRFKEDLDEKNQIHEDAKAYKNMKRFEDTQLVKDRENSALNALKGSLSKHKLYKDIFYRLPAQLIKALESIGLGVDDLGNVATSKVACHINNTLLNYVRSKQAYSNKELSLGKREEKEHTDVYKALTKDKSRKAPMTINQFAAAIAKAHLKEDPHYYSKLKKTFKSAMDFSGINNLITPEGELDERELARVIRLAISAELDAVHLYELIVDSSGDETVKKVLQDISNEEKIHAGELQELLKRYDPENEKFFEDGKKEVEEMISK